MAPVKKSSSKASKAGPSAVLPPPIGGPGGPIEIVFTFDTTGSMYSCLKEVRNKVNDVIQRLFTDIPNLKIAVFAHGDYCDKSNYVTKYVDFTNDVKKLCDFVQKVKSTGGGDWEECYELVLRQSRELLSWSPGTQRAMVMIGDAIPHPPNDSQNKDNIDWEEEAEKLKTELGVRVYAVQAYDSAPAAEFWRSLAKITYGKHLKLSQLDTIVDMMMAICYREHGAEYFEAYEKEVRAREGRGITKDVSRMFDALRDDEETSAAVATTVAAPPTTLKKAIAGTSKVFGKDCAVRKRGRACPTHKAARKPMRPKAEIYKKSKSTVAAKKSLKRAIKATMNDDHIKYSLGKEFRETVPETRFAFNNLDWTVWQQAMIPEKCGGDVTSNWIPRRDGEFGFRNSSLFSDGMSTPAMYEFSVQLKDGLKKYPVCFRTTTGCHHSGHWDSHLFRGKETNKKLTKALRKGCQVYARRAEIVSPVECNGQIAKGVRELRSLLRDTYNYSWMNHQQARKVVRKGVEISS